MLQAGNRHFDARTINGDPSESCELCGDECEADTNLLGSKHFCGLRLSEDMMEKIRRARQDTRCHVLTNDDVRIEIANVLVAETGLVEWEPEELVPSLFYSMTVHHIVELHRIVHGIMKKAQARTSNELEQALAEGGIPSVLAKVIASRFPENDALSPSTLRIG